MRGTRSHQWHRGGFFGKILTLAVLGMSMALSGCGGGDSGSGNPTVTPPGTGGFSFTDGFSGTRLNGANWADVEGVRQVVNGALRLAIGSNTADSKSIRAVPNFIAARTQLGATVTVNSYTNPNTSVPWLVGARVGGYFYNDGQSTGANDRTGDVFAQIRFIGNQVGYALFKCTTPLCDVEIAVTGTADNAFVSMGNITLGTAYPASITYNSTAKTLIFDVTGTGLTPVTYNITDATLVSPANIFYTLEVKSSGMAGTWVDATFDNVMANTVLHDDFATGSLAPAKWKDREMRNEVVAGALRTYAYADQASGSQTVIMRTVTTLPNKQAIAGALTVVNTSIVETVAGTSDVRAQSYALLRYRPEAGRTGTDQTGQFEIRAGVEDVGAGLVPYFSAYGCQDATCVTLHSLPAFTFTGTATLAKNTAVNVSVGYDHATKIATLKVGAQTATLDFSTVSAFDPANFWQGGLVTRVRLTNTVTGDSGSMEAAFDDVTYGAP